MFKMSIGVGLLTSVFIIVLDKRVSCCTISKLGVSNITRTEGDTDVLIPCLFPNSQITAWSIKYRNETSFRIYPQHAVYQANRFFINKLNIGILIENITAEMDGMSFQCWYTTPNQGFTSTPSEVGNLFVHTKESTLGLCSCSKTTSSAILFLPKVTILTAILVLCLKLLGLTF